MDPAKARQQHAKMDESSQVSNYNGRRCSNEPLKARFGA